MSVVAAACVLGGCGTRGGTSADPTSAVVGTVQLGPTCPVARPDHPCPDRWPAGVPVTVYSTAGRVVASTTTGRHGGFRVAVPPGRYAVTAKAGMSCRAVTVDLTREAVARVRIGCDTGIR